MVRWAGLALVLMLVGCSALPPAGFLRATPTPTPQPAPLLDTEIRALGKDNWRTHPVIADLLTHVPESALRTFTQYESTIHFEVFVGGAYYVFRYDWNGSAWEYIGVFCDAHCKPEAPNPFGTQPRATPTFSAPATPPAG